MMRNRRFSLRDFPRALPGGAALRQRVAALAGVSVFFAAVLIAVGLGQVVLVVVGLAALAGVLALIAWSVPRHDLQRILRAARSEQARQRLATLATRTVTTARRRSTHAVRRTRTIASTAAARAQRARTIRETQAVAQAVPPPTPEELYGWPSAGSDEVAAAPLRAKPRVDEERRRALELNARGAQLRRAGSPAPAAALHLEALEIFRSLNDWYGQAPTLNSLALALAATGETDAAVERFEQSLLILRERPDDPEQGKVIANLGFTLLRQGADDRGRELLSEALEKLPPESPAAHKVEAQLRRTS
jgi:tetratricopeptide (TPR) repeat protein